MKSGDSLSLISGRWWGGVPRRPILHKASRQAVGPNPNLIRVGLKLTIPSIQNYSQQQLAQARSDGRNWR